MNSHENPTLRERAVLPLEQRVLLLEVDMQRSNLQNIAIVETLALLRKDVATIQKYIWMGVGVLSAVTVLIQFIKH